MQQSFDEIRAAIAELYTMHAGRVLATLLRLLRGNFDLAEEALHDAFTAALQRWPEEGIPANPSAWLISAGKFRAIDRLRQKSRLDDTYDLDEFSANDLLASLEQDQGIEDDRLRLIFTCCHPGLALESQIALTLREVCGLKTEEIAAAFLIPVPTLAQRIVRAKNKIRDAGIPYEVPAPKDLPERLASVLHVIYLVFNEGYSAAMGATVTRKDLCLEAIRLARLVSSLLDHPEIRGLLALMLLHDARRLTRTDVSGELVPLEEQNRQLWNRSQIEEGCHLVMEALRSANFGAYTLQAAIAAVHAEAENSAATDWGQIVGLYEALLRISPSSVVELNRAVAVAMRDGPEAGLILIEPLLKKELLGDYHLAHAAKADLLRRLNRIEPAIASYEQALALTQQVPEQKFLMRRISELKPGM